MRELNEVEQMESRIYEIEMEEVVNKIKDLESQLDSLRKRKWSLHSAWVSLNNCRECGQRVCQH
jgi:hypothetical protein